MCSVFFFGITVAATWRGNARSSPEHVHVPHGLSPCVVGGGGDPCCWRGDPRAWQGRGSGRVLFALLLLVLFCLCRSLGLLSIKVSMPLSLNCVGIASATS